MATLSILGLYKADPGIFGGMQLPAGMRKQVFIDLLLAECAELEVLYPDPALMRQLITSWSNTRVSSWNKLFKSTMLEYNPLENYDRYETWEDVDGSTGNTSTTGSTIGSGTDRVAGYDSGRLVDRTAQNATTQDSTNVNSNTERRGNRSGHIHGNIGVTTPAQMIAGEREIYKYDVYAYIADEFKQRFLLLVY